MTLIGRFYTAIVDLSKHYFKNHDQYQKATLTQAKMYLCRGGAMGRIREGCSPQSLLGSAFHFARIR